MNKKTINIKNYGLINLKPGDLIMLNSFASFGFDDTIESAFRGIDADEIVMITKCWPRIFGATVLYKNQIGMITLNDQDLVVVE